MTTATYYLDAKGRTVIDKDPGATLDYLFDWSAFLGTDAIASVTASAVGVTVVGVPSFSGKVTTVWLAGGTLGQSASFTVTITTATNPARIEPMTVLVKLTPKAT
jgi:hypothetical protein